MDTTTSSNTPLSLDQQQTFERQLRNAKRQPDTAASELAEDELGFLDTASPILKTTAEFSEVSIQVLLQRLNSLLNQLPLVAKQSDLVIQKYFQDVVTELTKIYYVRCRLVKLDEQIILKTEREYKIQQLIAECKTRITEVATLLTYYHPHA
jgi:hypothetical protein